MVDPAAKPLVRSFPEPDTPAGNLSPNQGTRMRFTLTTGARPLEGYTVKRGVGVGGFGEVYFALTDAGKEVALKRINRNLEIELRGVRQCLNLKHVNLVDLYDIRKDPQGEHWVVMEYVGGEPLSDCLDRYPQGMPEEEIHRWMTGLLAGVGYLHRHGIVHRDLKPGNIFSEEGIVKIGDYGLSKFISCSRRSGHTESVGTMHYMAPEIGQGRYGKEIDIYALGILLHELVTGRVPFDGETSQEIIIKHLTAEPDLAGIGEPYRSVIAKALEKDPQRRYGEVSQMAEDLGLTDVAATGVNGSSASESRSEYVQPGTARGGTSGLKETVALVTAEEVPEPPRRHVPPCNRQPNETHTFSRDSQIGVLLAMGAVLALLFGGWWALLVVGGLGAIYAAAVGLRRYGGGTSSWSQGGVPQPSELLPPEEYLPDGRPRYFTKGQIWRRHMMNLLRQKPLYRHSLELTDGLLVSTVVAAVLSLLMMILSGSSLLVGTAAWSLYLWLFITTTLMAWCLLAAGKFWEGRQGDQVLRRFVVLVIGLALGASAYATQQALMVDIGLADVEHAISVEQVTDAMYDESDTDGTPGNVPLLGAFMGYFAALLVVPRWWLQLDPLRNMRLNPWSVVVVGFWAYVLNAFWPFPQPWGWMIPAAAAAALQMAAPWIRKEPN